MQKDDIDESGQITVTGHIFIRDVTSGKVIVNKRDADISQSQHHVYGEKNERNK